jgi:hypothetical protein
MSIIFSKNSPHTPTFSFLVSACTYYFYHFSCTSSDSIYYRHTPTSKEFAQPLFVCHPLYITTFYLPISFFWWNPINVVRQICRLYTNQNFQESIFFLLFHYPTHSLFTFCLPRKLLFVYLPHPKYPFCLPGYNIVVLLHYLCIVWKVLFVYLLKTTSYLQPRITCFLFFWPS